MTTMYALAFNGDLDDVQGFIIALKHDTEITIHFELNSYGSYFARVSTEDANILQHTLNAYTESGACIDAHMGLMETLH